MICIILLICHFPLHDSLQSLYYFVLYPGVLSTMHPHPLNQVYATYMRNHPYGTAVYRPIPFRDFHPGSVGYFDANGEWNIITDLSNATTLQSSNLSPVPEPLQRAPTDSHIEWGPKASRNINSRKAEFSAGVSPALATVLPANASAHLTFYNSTTGGALLLTTPPITHERLYHETPFKRWVHNNAVELVRQREELLEYGLWIVLSTHTTSDCAIHVWDDAQKTVDVGFDVSVDAVGELGPAGGWTIGRGDGGWERYTATGVCLPFLSGLCGSDANENRMNKDGLCSSGAFIFDRGGSQLERLVNRSCLVG